MRLEHVVINHVRILNDVRVDLSPGLNVLFGENASGKTSFLESLHLLAYARSFRSHQLKNIINHESDYLRITGKIVSAGRSPIPVGVEYRNSRLRMRANGQEIKKTSELAQFLPIIIIHQECQRLLTDGPKFRRKFLDWGVFHVEQGFLNAWRRYSRALKQRNSVLQGRKGRTVVAAWDLELKNMALAIHSYRLNYCDAFIPVLQQCLGQLVAEDVNIRVSYQAGWDVQQDYLDVLAASYEQDARRGFTHQGPHRADLMLKVGGMAAHENLSRGQQKLLVCSMLIAQALVYQQRTGSRCIILVDDLKAELDSEHVARVMALLQGIKAQIIMTATEKEVLKSFCLDGSKTFHVERGRVTEVV